MQETETPAKVSRGGTCPHGTVPQESRALVPSGSPQTSHSRPHTCSHADGLRSTVFTFLGGRGMGQVLRSRCWQGRTCCVSFIRTAVVVLRWVQLGSGLSYMVFHHPLGFTPAQGVGAEFPSLPVSWLVHPVSPGSELREVSGAFLLTLETLGDVGMSVVVRPGGLLALTCGGQGCAQHPQCSGCPDVSSARTGWDLVLRGETTPSLSGAWTSTCQLCGPTPPCQVQPPVLCFRRREV